MTAPCLCWTGDDREAWETGVAAKLTHCGRCGLPVLPADPVYRSGSESRHPCCDREAAVLQWSERQRAEPGHRPSR